jgi:2,4-dienoyl-CoA reductase-like NADH-dependent reductase (Old Yellow Enzyme family)
MLKVLQDIVSSQAFVQVVVAIVAAVWSIPRLQQWLAGVKATKWEALLELGENAVIQTWNSYTSGLKAAAADGKLTADQAKLARQQATATLRQLAEDELQGVINTYGNAAVEALVAKIYATLKNQGVVG